jgi:large subunit ribosomal protein L4e
MKADIHNLQGEKVKTLELPEQFNEEVRPEIIKRAVLSIQSNKRQPYGSKPGAGMRYSSKLSRRRRKYKTAYGHGISRVPRKIMSRRGRNFFWVGARAPNTVGGRRTHPPKAWKIWSQKINTKERRLAIRSALAATCDKELVKQRGHLFTNVPFIIESDFESVKTTKAALNILLKLGLAQELERSSVKRIRPGMGKTRGRGYTRKKGPLIVVSGRCALYNSAKNIPGVDIVSVESLNAELLAPGCMLGRLTIFTDKAIERMAKEKLFTGIKVEEKKTKEAKK